MTEACLEDRLRVLEERIARVESALPVRLGPQPESIDEAERRTRDTSTLIAAVKDIQATSSVKHEVVLPVDRTQQTLTDGSPVTEDHRELRPDGMHKAYVVLSAEERAKGFVRPVRRSYQHIGASGPTHPLRDLTDEEKERYAQYGCAKFEKYPQDDDSSVTGMFWTQARLDNIRKGCGTVTTMGSALAETYARDPSFYGATFCCECGKHLPVEEFVWDGTWERVGS